MCTECYFFFFLCYLWLHSVISVCSVLYFLFSVTCVWSVLFGFVHCYLCLFSDCVCSVLFYLFSVICDCKVFVCFFSTICICSILFIFVQCYLYLFSVSYVYAVPFVCALCYLCLKSVICFNVKLLFLNLVLVISVQFRFKVMGHRCGVIISIMYDQ